MEIIFHQFLIHVVVYCKPILSPVPIKHPIERKTFQCNTISITGSPVCCTIIKVLHRSVYLLAANKITFYFLFASLGQSFFGITYIDN